MTTYFEFYERKGNPRALSLDVVDIDIPDLAVTEEHELTDAQRARMIDALKRLDLTPRDDIPMRYEP